MKTKLKKKVSRKSGRQPSGHARTNWTFIDSKAAERIVRAISKDKEANSDVDRAALAWALNQCPTALVAFKQLSSEAYRAMMRDKLTAVRAASEHLLNLVDDPRVKTGIFDEAFGSSEARRTVPNDDGFSAEPPLHSELRKSLAHLVYSTKIQSDAWKGSATYYGGSAMDWLIAVRLGGLFKETFGIEPTIIRDPKDEKSRKEPHPPRGTYIEFVQAALKELGVRHSKNKEYSAETIARAFYKHRKFLAALDKVAQETIVSS